MKFAKENGLNPAKFSAYHATDFVEQMRCVCGDIPERYQYLQRIHCLNHLLKKTLDKMTVPELTVTLKALNVEIPQGAKKES